MTVSLTIRNVPVETRNELATRAARSGRSLQEYLRLLVVAEAAEPDLDAVMARVRARKEQIGGELSAEKIVAHRDAGRR